MPYSYDGRETPEIVGRVMTYDPMMGYIAGLGIDDTTTSGISIIEKAKLKAYTQGFLSDDEIRSLADEIRSMWDGGPYSFQTRELMKDELGKIAFELKRMCEAGYQDSKPMKQLRDDVDAQIKKLTPSSAVSR